ncbi:MAG: NUMOD4 domain-containing protein, partial [Intestinibacter sp.]
MISPVSGFEGYYITSFGRVISAKKKYKQKTLEGEIYEATIYKILKP